MASPALPRKLAGRYETKQILGQGGMGLVYRAYDTVVRRDVAVKTLRDIPEPMALQLFYKECDVLASMSHPNIVEIFDIGQFEEDGKSKPYFVMPLLPGATLENLMRTASHRLTVERTVEIISQSCRGLQAAHERGLVHRDLKPSNIFVLEDDSVKIIDFGVAHITDAHSTRGQKGTLLYMSPEQIEMKPLSGLSDIFSLSVVCYEALTGRQPFRGAKADDIIDAILHQIPPPASEVNFAVSQAISRVVHKGMAKQSWHRFSTAREFGECLNKALRNEPIEFFDPARIQPRLQRATRALEEGDYQFAGEILGELQAEGHIDTSIAVLQHELDRAVRRKSISQLLESAKARFEEGEDPLALQKIQEVLQLEPDNTTAFALKSKIENRRGDRQIENWYRLARQHIDNHAYAHAREALQNVLQLRPKEARAVQLLSEVDRQEQEYTKLRQEKMQLHHTAMEAWHKGDVSSALSKMAVVLELDRRAPDSSSPERSTTYQSFYNQVRSEHDAMNNAYAEARKCLADRGFSKALSVCDAYLKKYPYNALFQALKFDVQEQQRQELSAFIAAVDRQVEGEPDLEKRVKILKDALQLHPDETHFQRSLRLAQDKRDLVDSIVARARLREEQDLFSEALGDWEILRTIYSQYPGLKFEIDRVQKRREQQSRLQAKSRWVEQIDSSMHSGDYARALELLQRAGAEFPNDAELDELEKAARESAQRANEAQQFMTEGQDLCGQNRFSEGVKLLRRAYQLDEHNALARSVLATALLEQAQSLLESDLASTEELVQQALDLNPGHPMAKSLRTLVLDRKREQYVSECVSQARKLQVAGDLAGAFSRIEEGLSSYPNDARLLQIRETLRKEIDEFQRREIRRRDLDELRRLEKLVDRNPEASVAQSLNEQVQTLATKYENDEEFSSVVIDLRRRLTPAGSASPRSGWQQDLNEQPPNATQFFEPAGAPVQKVREAERPAVPREAPPVREAPRPAFSPARMGKFSAPPTSSLQSALAMLTSARDLVRHRAGRIWLEDLKPRFTRTLGDLPRKPFPKLWAVVTGTSIVLLVLLAIVWHMIKPEPRPAIPPSATTVRVRINVAPPGATIKVNNEVRGVSDVEMELPLGSYNINAELDGYQPASTTLELKADSPQVVPLTLQPHLSTVKIVADSGAGKVWIDDQPAGDVGADGWTHEGLVAGEHKLRFAGPQGETTLDFQLAANSPPLLKQAMRQRGLHAVVVANFENRARVYCSFCPAKLSLDSQPEVYIGADGIELSNVPPGTHKLALKQENDQHSLQVQLGFIPTLSLFLLSDNNVGSLLVLTGEDKVQIFVDGQADRRTTQGGLLRIPNLQPKTYLVRVAKSGYQDVPEQTVVVQKGEQSKLVFKMEPLPRLASLSIQGGVLGTEVLVDQISVGSVQENGTFHSSAVAPGDHTIELRKERFKPTRLQKHFVAGSEVTLAASEAALELATGELRITFTPPDANVTLMGGGEGPQKITSGRVLNLPPGAYTVWAQTNNYTRSSVVEVVAGESRSFELKLAPGGMAEWDVPGGWRSENNLYMRRGGGLVLYRTSPTLGTFVFSALLRKGHKLQWVLNCTDARNYVLFQMDGDYFYRNQVRNGQLLEGVRIPHKSENKQFRTFQIRVSANEIVTQIQDGPAWRALDTLSLPSDNFSLGKFGFLIPGNDEVALSNFKHYGELTHP